MVSLSFEHVWNSFMYYLTDLTTKKKPKQPEEKKDIKPNIYPPKPRKFKYNAEYVKWCAKTIDSANETIAHYEWIITTPWSPTCNAYVDPYDKAVLTISINSLKFRVHDQYWNLHDDELLELRVEARTKKDFVTSDILRNVLDFRLVFVY